MKLRIPKIPKFKLPQRRKESPQRLEARLRASAAATADAYDEDEPQTKLTGALIVVAILHFVAVGGIYAFNQIKSSRRVHEVAPPVATKTTTKPKTTAPAEPSAAETKSAPAQSAPAVAQVAPVLKQRVYNVKPGDTLIGIAKNFDIAVNDLKAANGMGNDTIRVGQVLNLPGAKSAAAEPAPAPAVVPVTTKTTTSTKAPELATKNYTVKSGDRLVFIAKKFGVTQEDLVALNKIKDPGKLQVGQTLKVPAKKGN